MDKKTCRICSSNKLNIILGLGNIYLSDFRKDSHKPLKFPLTLIMCANCKLIQLKHTVPARKLYTDRYGYKSGINNTMIAELKDIAENSRLQYGKKNKQLTVVDIGANDGTLIKNYPRTFTKIIVEPIKKFADEAKVYADYVINDFFNYESYSEIAGNIKADIITAIACFYDIDNPNDFIENVKKILKKDGIFVIQQNYVVAMLKNNAFDNIVHEHLEYYSLHSLQFLLKRHNLEVFNVEERQINGGSFRTYIAFKGEKTIRESVSLMLKEEKKIGIDNKDIYLAFSKRIKKNKKVLMTFLKKQIKIGKRIYIYGASTRGNTLLQYLGVTKKLTPFAVERNPGKWGKNISSLDIPIISEDRARKERPDYMLVLPWFFKEEFLEREKSYLDQGGHFIFPLPEFELL